MAFAPQGRPVLVRGRHGAGKGCPAPRLADLGSPLGLLGVSVLPIVSRFMKDGGAWYSSYFVDEKTRWKGHGVIKSSDGLYTYHDRLVILRMAQDLCILLLTECSYNVGHQNWQ